MQKDNNNNSEIFVKCTPLTYNRAWHAVHNSNTNYTHTETPQAENENNDDYKQMKPQAAKQKDLHITHTLHQSAEITSEQVGGDGVC